MELQNKYKLRQWFIMCSIVTVILDICVLLLGSSSTTSPNYLKRRFITCICAIMQSSVFKMFTVSKYISDLLICASNSYGVQIQR